MKCCDSATRSMASRTSPRMEAYCAFRSSSGTGRGCGPASSLVAAVVASVFTMTPPDSSLTCGKRLQVGGECACASLGARQRLVLGPVQAAQHARLRLAVAPAAFRADEVAVAVPLLEAVAVPAHPGFAHGGHAGH